LKVLCDHLLEELINHMNLSIGGAQVKTEKGDIESTVAMPSCSVINSFTVTRRIQSQCVRKQTSCEPVV
jgi:hypothetical protein